MASDGSDIANEHVIPHRVPIHVKNNEASVGVYSSDHSIGANAVLGLEDNDSFTNDGRRTYVGRGSLPSAVTPVYVDLQSSHRWSPPFL